MRTKLAILVALLVLLGLLFGCPQTSPVCGDGICSAVSSDFNESNPNSYFYCPADCGSVSTHAECVNKQCTQVPGVGLNKCTANSDCQTDFHSECSNKQCVLVEGLGTDLCNTNTDCEISDVNQVQILINPSKNSYIVGETITLQGVSQNAFLSVPAVKAGKASFLSIEPDSSSFSENKINPVTSYSSNGVLEYSNKKYLVSDKSKIPMVIESNDLLPEVVENEYIVELKLNSLSVEESKIFSQIQPLKEQLDNLNQQLVGTQNSGGLLIQITQMSNLIKSKELELLSAISTQKIRLSEEHMQFVSLINQVKQSGISPDLQIVEEYKNVFNGFLVHATESEVNQLKTNQNVKKIYQNQIVKATLMDSVGLIKADKVWQLKDSNLENVTGKGVSIAVIDTGIDYTHPDLGGSVSQERSFTKLNDSILDLGLKLGGLEGFGTKVYKGSIFCLFSCIL